MSRDAYIVDLESDNAELRSALEQLIRTAIKAKPFTDDDQEALDAARRAVTWSAERWEGTG